MNRLVLLAIALGIGSVAIVPVAEAVEPLMGAGAVLALALAGVWMIIRAPFGRF
ncbi:MAG: hypothetical protein WD404_05160 [Solirubrobacterales bacterium]